MDTNNICFFSNYPDNSMDSNSFYAYIETANNKAGLLRQLDKKLQFPSYFGYNWDALYELFSDFWWIKQKNISIYHQGVRSIPFKDLNIYVKILVDICHIWNKYPEHDVCFFFNEEDRNIITSIINKIGRENQRIGGGSS